MQLSTKAKESIKTALAVTIAYGIALALDWGKPGWAGWAAALVSLSTVGQSFSKASLRLFGTLVGGIVALALLGTFPQDRWLFMTAFSVYVGFCVYMMGGTKYQYFWQVSGFVCGIICSSVGPHSVDAFNFAVLRTQETGLGIVVYSTVALLLWPVTSRAPFNATLQNIGETQQQVLHVLLDLMKGKGPAEDHSALVAKLVQQQTEFKQLLHDASIDTQEVSEVRRQWYAYHDCVVDLSEVMARCRESLDSTHHLDLPDLIPNLNTFANELEMRLVQVERILSGQRAERAPVISTVALEDAMIGKLSNYEKAVLAVICSRLEELEKITRALYSAASEIKGYFHDGEKSIPATTTRYSIIFDPERMLNVFRVMLALWVAFLTVIYLPDIPGGFGIIGLLGSLAIAIATVPQLSWGIVFIPVNAAIVFSSLVYMLLMPKLSNFLELGLLLFTVTFCISYIFSNPRYAPLKLITLSLFYSLTSISNHQSYSFMVAAFTGLEFNLILLCLLIVSFIPASPRQEKVFLRLLGRFFRSSSVLVSAAHNQSLQKSNWLQRFRYNYHVYELTTIPLKLSVYGKFINFKALPGSSSQQVEELQTSIQILRNRLLEVLSERERSQIIWPSQVLHGDVQTWSLQVENELHTMAAAPVDYDNATFRLFMSDMLEQFEKHIDEAMDKEKQAQLTREEGMDFYRLLGVYKGFSEALIGYSAKAADVDWIPWHIERF